MKPSLLEETLHLLRASNLNVIAKQFERWCRSPANVHKSHIELMHTLMVAHDHTKRSGRMDRFITRAGFSSTVSINNVWTHPGRGLTPRMLANLAACAWVDNGSTLVIAGDHSVGKSFLAAALAREAALTRPGVHYRVLSKLLAELDGDDRNVKKIMGQLLRARLLVLDHFAEDVVSEKHGTLLRDLLDARKDKLATIIVSAKPFDEWSLAFENAGTGEAVAHRVFGGDATIITLRTDKKTLPTKKCRRAIGKPFR
jgi:DNA replication protein DnaC